jgi:hypothetical protein
MPTALVTAVGLLFPHCRRPPFSSGLVSRLALVVRVSGCSSSSICISCLRPTAPSAFPSGGCSLPGPIPARSARSPVPVSAAYPRAPWIGSLPPQSALDRIVRSCSCLLALVPPGSASGIGPASAAVVPGIGSLPALARPRLPSPWIVPGSTTSVVLSRNWAGRRLCFVAPVLVASDRLDHRRSLLFFFRQSRL